MTIAFVQSAANEGTSITSLTCAYGSNNTAGNLLIGAVRVGGTTTATITYSDTQSNSWTSALTQGQTTDGHEAGMGFAPNCKSGANTVTTAQNGSAGTLFNLIAEYSGLATSSPLDKSSSNQQNGVSTSTPITTGASGTTTQSAELLCAIATLSTAYTSAMTANSFGTGSGTANIRQYSQLSNNYKMVMWDAVTTSTGSYTGSITVPSGTANAAAILLTFLSTNPGVSLTGQGITSGQGSMSKTTQIGMSQNLATSAIGSLTPTLSVTLTGQLITSAQGSLATALILPHLGITSAQGSPSPGTGVLMGHLTISTSQGSFTVKVQNRTNLPTAPPTVRSVNMQALAYEVDGPVRPYPIYQFSRGRVFIKRPYENPAAGEVSGSSSSGGGPGL